VKTILVLEDNPAVMGIFRVILNAHTILEATTVEEALQRFIENDRLLDLMISDVVLATGLAYMQPCSFVMQFQDCRSF